LPISTTLSATLDGFAVVHMDISILTQRDIYGLVESSAQISSIGSGLLLDLVIAGESNGRPRPKHKVHLSYFETDLEEASSL